MNNNLHKRKFCLALNRFHTWRIKLFLLVLKDKIEATNAVWHFNTARKRKNRRMRRRMGLKWNRRKEVEEEWRGKIRIEKNEQEGGERRRKKTEK